MQSGAALSLSLSLYLSIYLSLSLSLFLTIYISYCLSSVFLSFFFKYLLEVLLRFWLACGSCHNILKRLSDTLPCSYRRTCFLYVYLSFISFYSSNHLYISDLRHILYTWSVSNQVFQQKTYHHFRPRVKAAGRGVAHPPPSCHGDLVIVCKGGRVWVREDGGFIRRCSRI